MTGWPRSGGAARASSTRSRSWARPANATGWPRPPRPSPPGSSRSPTYRSSSASGSPVPSRRPRRRRSPTASSSARRSCAASSTGPPRPRSARSWRRCGPLFPRRSPCDDRQCRQSRRADGRAKRPDGRRGGSSMARYRAIAADLAAKIRDGRYAPGEALPAQRELSAAYGVTLMTLRQALRELDAEGLIVQRPGKGTFVAPSHLAYQLGSLRSLADDLREQGHEVRTMVIARAQRRVPRRIAAQLRVRETETGLRLERVRAFAGRRAIHQVSWVREPYADRLHDVDFTATSLYAALADAGVAVHRASETIRPETLDGEAARHLA